MLFEMRGLTKVYNGLEALNIPALSLAEGKIYGLVGPNGAGKTTLLEILTGLLAATTGVVRFKGEPIDTTEASLAVRRRITFLAQNPVLFRGSVIENVEYGLKVRGVGKAERRQRALRALERVDLPHLANRQGHTLSAGERQRTAFARAICVAPEAILLDEPTANVDQQSAVTIHALIRRLNSERGTSIVFTSHDIEETISLADEIIGLRAGHLAPAPVENLFSGNVEHADDRSFVRVSDALRIEVVTDKVGKAKVTINPQTILLSSAPLVSSARNSFKGRIRQVVEIGHLARVTVDIGIPLVAEITQASLKDMALRSGAPVHLSFKSTSVHVY
jgi:tungstate transport system ATP-binding protein